MLDTNQIQQAAEVAKEVHAQAAANWPAICFASALLARELRQFNVWIVGVMEWVMKHGGVGWLVWKLVWNPPLQTPPPINADERR